MHEGDSFSSKLSGKNLFLCQTDWSSNGQAGQSDKWKAASVSCQPFISSLYAVILVICGVNIKGQAAWSAWHMAPSCV